MTKKRTFSPEFRLETPQGQCYACGESGTVLRYNGREWTDFSAGTENFLYGVWGDGLDNIYAVGDQGTILRRT